MSMHETHVVTRDEVMRTVNKPLPRALTLASAILAAIGTVIFLVGALTGVERAWQAMLFNWSFFTAISSAGVAFVAVQRITTARWSRPIIRIMEGYVAFLPVAFLLLLVIVLVGKGHIFPWTHEAPPSHERQIYLDPTFFTLRVLITFAIITILSVWYIWTSVRLDVGLVPEWGASWARGFRERMRRGYREERRELHSTHSLQGTLAVWLCLAFAFGWCILAFDLSMTLDLHFESTLYGWWFFMGGWLGALMAFALLVMAWRRHLGAYDLITENHFHDIGKLCFAFTAFWGYLTFSQYLIMWYGNMAFETHWMRLRLIDPWKMVTVPMLVMLFILPFFGLMSRAAKVFLPTMAFFAVVSLLGLWLLRFTEVYPSLHHESTSVPLGVWEIGVFLGYLGIWGLCYTSFMNAFPQMRVTLMTSPFRDEVQVPVDAETMEPLPAHE